MKTANSSKSKDFEFPNLIREFLGYDSSRDKTNIVENAVVRGSQNVYKKLSGTMAVRQGQKRRGVANGALSPVSSEFVWNTSWGATYVLTVSNSTLYAVLDDVWYPLQTGLTKYRYVFDKWYDTDEAKDRTVFVNGGPDLMSWSGGLTFLNQSAGTVTAINPVPTSGGAGYSVDDVLTITFGGTGATVKVTGIMPLTGEITGIQLVTSGAGYTTGAGKSTSGGTGTLATVEVTSVASPSATTLTKENAKISWQQAGFSTTSGQKRIMIAGTEYTYTGGETTATLTGVSPDPSAIPTGTVAIQSVVTTPNTPAVGFSNDFMKTINNQVYVGSYTSRLIHISDDTDYTNYTVPVQPAPGDPQLVTLDGTGKGIGVRQGKAHIGFGSGSWAVVSLVNSTEAGVLVQRTNTEIKPVAIGQAPYAHEFIDTVGDSLVYLAQDQQLRTFGDFNNLFTPGYPSFSQEIATELMQQDFTGGSLKCIGEFTYACAPREGKVYLYQVRQKVDIGGNVVAERLWHPPFVWNATHIDAIGQDVVAFSNANPQIYDVWDTGQWHDDSPSDEAVPYECVLSMAYKGGARRQGLWSYDKTYTEGYITPGTPLNLNTKYNFDGALASADTVINSFDNPAYLFTPNISSVPSLGDSSLGDEPLGDALSQNGGGDGMGDLVKFRRINSMNLRNCFEYQLTYSSFAADAQWEILAFATNAAPEPDQDATFINTKPIR